MFWLLIMMCMFHNITEWSTVVYALSKMTLQRPFVWYFTIFIFLDIFRQLLEWTVQKCSKLNFLAPYEMRNQTEKVYKVLGKPIIMYSFRESLISIVGLCQPSGSFPCMILDPSKTSKPTCLGTIRERLKDSQIQRICWIPKRWFISLEVGATSKYPTFRH